MREQRKVVTILFADVVGSTELATQRDPEVVRSVMSRYFRRVGEIASAYGGTVEKFAGDSAMVVFGVPTVHDDDAERAVRAALEIRDSAVELAIRVGVNTGESVTAVTEDRQFMVSGDAVNIAARLQQGADAGEVIVGPLTHQLTRSVIEYEDRAPVSAKGKPEPLAAFRAMRPVSSVPVQARGVPGLHAALVGRDRELRLLVDTFARASEHRNLHLFTIVGAAGIGKSRLVSEALARLAGSGAHLMRGRCLPYGRGITYWPLIEMLREETGIALADERNASLAKLDRWLGELMAGDAERPAIQARLAVMLGLETPLAAMGDAATDRVNGEIGWAVRRFLEAVAQNAPLIVVIDDIQWAEPPVITLIEHMAERALEVPILIVCVARPEFLETHGGWSSGKANTMTITLDPLSAQETSTLVSRLLEIEALPAELRRQIIDRSSGTPLFCEEFIHMLIDEGVVVRLGDHWQATATLDQIRVPQGINAVLAARLDLLSEDERSALQSASVIGQRFGLREVAAVTEARDVEPVIERLRHKGLVTGGDRPAEEYRFRHLLIRDAAYGSLPKSRRADLPDAYRSELEGSGDPLQVAEIIAYHAERAFTLSQEVGLDESVVVERAGHAVQWLLTLAERARTRHEVVTMETALMSLRAAAETLPDAGGAATQARMMLLTAQLLVMKADYRRAREAAARAATLGEAADLPSVVAAARLAEAWIINFDQGAGALEEFQAAVERAIAASRRAGDVPGEIEARHVGTNTLWGTGHLADYTAVNEELVRRAQSIGDVAHEAWIKARLAPALGLRGDHAAAHRYMEQAEALAQKHGLRHVTVRVRFDQAAAVLRTGDFAAAAQKWIDCAREAEDAGDGQHLIGALRFLGHTLLYAHKPAEAASALDRALQLSRERGERWNRTEILALRAQAALDLADLALADRLIGESIESLRKEDVSAESESSMHLGLIRAEQGRHLEAEAALRRALDVVVPTDYNAHKIESASSLADFLASRGRGAEAARIREEYSALAVRLKIGQGAI